MVSVLPKGVERGVHLLFLGGVILLAKAFFLGLVLRDGFVQPMGMGWQLTCGVSITLGMLGVLGKSWSGFCGRLHGSAIHDQAL